MKSVIFYYPFLLSALFFPSFSFSQLAGTPGFSVVETTASAEVNEPLNSPQVKTCQWILGPSCFFAGGSASGTPAAVGRISSLFLQLGTTANSGAIYSDFSVKLAQPFSLSFQSDLPLGEFQSGLTQVFYAETFIPVGAVSGTYIQLPLQADFVYDPSRPLVIEISSSGGLGNTLRHNQGSGIKRLFNQGMSGGSESLRVGVNLSSAFTNDIAPIGLVSPLGYCSGPQAIQARIRNCGSNSVSGFTLNWSLNGVVKTPLVVSGNLTTSSREVTILLGNENFGSTAALLKIWTTLPNGQSDNNRHNDTLQHWIQPALSGTYTLNPNASGPLNFRSLTEAFLALQKQGVCGPVRVEVAPGTYQGPFVLGEIPGASPGNTVVFDGIDAQNCILESKSSGGVVVLNGTDYVQFRNFTIRNLLGINPAGIALVGQVRAALINKNKFELPVLGASGSIAFGVIATGTPSGITLTAGDPDSVWVDSNSITGGFYGVAIMGMGNSAKNAGIKVRGNSMKSIQFRGIHLSYILQPLDVIGNTIELIPDNAASTGIHFEGNASVNTTTPHQLIRNTILNFSNSGIYCVNSLTGTSTAPMRVIGNVLNSSTGSANYLVSFGIYITSSVNGAVDIYHNTVAMNGMSSSATDAALFTFGWTNIKLRNNIFAVFNGNYTPVYIANPPGTNTLNNNVYYNAAGGNSNLIFRGSYYNATNFKQASVGGDSSSNLLPAFVRRLPVANSDLHVLDDCHGKGTNLKAFVPLDMDADSFQTNPSIGADQFKAAAGPNLRITRLLKPTTTIPASSDVEFEVLNFGTVSVTNYQASYRNNLNPVQSITRVVNLPVCALDTARFTGGMQINLGTRNRIVAYTSQPNNLQDVQASNDTLATMLFGPLNGVYTVGGVTPDFETVQQAAQALSAGVSGPVTFDIRPGTYIGQVIITGQIPGASSINRIVFEGNDAATRSLLHTGRAPVVVVTNAKYLSFRNLSLVSQSSGFACGIGLVSPTSIAAVSGIRIKNCRFILPLLTSTNSAGFGVLMTSVAGATDIGATGADSVEIDSNYFFGGGYGVYLSGSSSNSYNRGMFVRSNVFEKINNTGISFISVFPPIRILKNRIQMQVEQNGLNGISLILCTNSNTTTPSDVSGNFIDGFTQAGIILTNPVAASSTARIRVSNNLVLGNRTGVGTGGNYGITLSQNANCNADVVNNTVAMFAASTTNTAFGCFLNSGSTNTFLKNNVFVVFGGAYVPVYQSTAITSSLINSNLYYNYTNPQTGALIFRNSTYYNPTNYKTSQAAGGSLSYNQAPPFKSSTDFSLISSCLRGENLSGLVPLDIRDTLRASLPTVGAYEYPASALDILPVRVVGPVFPIQPGTQTLSVLVRNNGKTPVNNFNLSYQLQGFGMITQQVNQTLNACDTAIISFTVPIQLVSGSNPLRIFTSSPNSVQDGFPENDTLHVALASPLIGDYILGKSPADFSGFNEAWQALQSRGAAGKVRFLAKTGTYIESLVLGNYPGRDSAQVSITFSSLAQHADSVRLISNNQGATNPAVVDFKHGAFGINVEKISVENVAASTNQLSACIQFEGLVNRDTIRDCKLIARVFDPVLNPTLQSALVYSQQGYGHGICIQNTWMSGSNLGISISGTASNYYRGLNLEGNTINHARSAPLSTLRFTRNSSLKSNQFYHTPTQPGTGIMDFQNNDSGFVFVGNTILGGTNALVIRFQNMQGLAANPALLANNKFASLDSLLIQLGPQLVSGLKFYHNTLVLGKGSLLVNGTSGNGIQLKNNIIFGSKPQVYQLPSPLAQNFQSDFNNVFSPFSSSPYQVLGVSKNLYEIRNGNGLELNSISHWPGWENTSAALLNLSDSASWTVNGRGTHLSEVTEDIHGNPRPMNPAQGVPDLGAEELEPNCNAPFCLAVPQNPVAGQTQHFLLGQDTVARIAWANGNPVPSSLVLRPYSGRKPPHLDTASTFMYYYLDMQGDTGAWNYSLHLKIKPEWRGTILNYGTNLKLARYSMPGGWQVYPGLQSNLQSGLNLLSASSLSKGKSLFTGADELSPLPVSLLSFEGSVHEKDVQLSWTSGMEENLDRYEVESSVDGIEFEKLGQVAARGNSRQLLDYYFLHAAAFDSRLIRYYRLKMVDWDGSFAYSKTIRLHAGESPERTVEVFPNPFTNSLAIQGLPKGIYAMELIDASGKQVWTAMQQLEQEGICWLHLPDKLEKGIYVLQVKGDLIYRFKLLNPAE
ncbi:MAG: T9SS type A sorting domain-containing protein [Bacteroidia bacterium]|nr:T9SS type A sorting domain-containing protein [Bacteroidia bacterium]